MFITDYLPASNMDPLCNLLTFRNIISVVYVEAQRQTLLIRSIRGSTPVELIH